MEVLRNKLGFGVEERVADVVDGGRVFEMVEAVGCGDDGGDGFEGEEGVVGGCFDVAQVEAAEGRLLGEDAVEGLVLGFGQVCHGLLFISWKLLGRGGYVYNIGIYD